MNFDTGTFREIADTLGRNKSRSLLTGFGIFWGVFMLIFLIGGKKGIERMLMRNFDGFATNCIIIVSDQTSKPYHGLKKGRQWQLRVSDVERLRQQVPELDLVEPVLTLWGKSVQNGTHSTSCQLKGLRPAYFGIEQPRIKYGRALNDMDLRQQRKVCVIGRQIYESLFAAGTDPCGEMVRVDSTYYKIVGVDVSDGDIQINGWPSTQVSIPITVLNRVYNTGDKVHLVAATCRKGVHADDIKARISSVVGRNHDISPDDEKAVVQISLQIMFTMLERLMAGVGFMAWLIGIGTLLAGAIGVSNIMMVTVRERTVEIGIRRAIGATPRRILAQILSESVALTAMAGTGGILLAVAILQIIETAAAGGEPNPIRWQIGFGTAMAAFGMIGTLGIAAGLAPAARAMAIKPVDAMRDE